MYAPTYVGFIGVNKATMADWRQTMTTDKHSVRILPDITSMTSRLEPLSPYDLLCEPSPFVSRDIENKARTEVMAIMGCYEVNAATINGSLVSIVGLQDGNIEPTDTVKVVVANTGTSSLTSVNLGWSINDVIQNGNLNIPVNLPYGQSTTLSLGQLGSIIGETTVKVWINNLNGGSAGDALSEDDTIKASYFICNGSYSGRYIVGAMGYFRDMTDVFNKMNICGISGDITLAFESGTYSNIDLANNTNIFGNYFLTITSASGINDVTFASALPATVLCNNTNNVIFKNITIDATLGQYCIQFTGAANNITVDSCILRTNTVTTGTLTSVSHACIYKLNNAGMLSNLTVKNCILDGGLCGVYLYGLSSARYQNTVFENNTLTNQSLHSIYLSYVDNNSISRNRVSPRTANQGTQWNGIFLDNCNGGNITGNYISAYDTLGITSILRGLNLANTSTFVANNEIFLDCRAATIQGIRISYCGNLSIIHNTVYTNKNTSGGTTNRAFDYGGTGRAYSAVIKNNIFAAANGPASTTYAIYFDATPTALNNYAMNYEIDYNNYHSKGTNLANVASGNRVDLDAWKTIMKPYSLDSHSVNMLPAFDNPFVDLNLLNYPDTLLCPSVQDVSTDIRNIVRPSITAMGAYTQFVNGQDLMLMQFHEWKNEIVQNQTVPVNVVLRNIGNVPVSSAQLGWSVDNQYKGSVTWTAPPVLNSLEDRIIYIGSFKAINPSSYDISVWIEEVNTETDSLNGNDTLRTSASLKPLAEFTTPHQDTIEELSFDVNVLIRQGTGATLTTPEITIISIVHETTTIYDTISLTLNNDIWQASIPPQYYGTKVFYSLFLSDTVNNSITLIDSTYIRNTSSLLGDTNLITLSLAPLPTTGCLPDNTPVAAVLTNKGTISYNFIKDTLIFELEIIDPDTIKHTATVPFTGTLHAGINAIELTSALSILHPGEYKIKVWLRNPMGNTIYIDTLRTTYISGRIGLPINEDFSAGFPLEFEVFGSNTSAEWKVSKGDSEVEPFFGDSLLSFTGNMGAMSTFATRQMDLSRTIAPSLSFWYFHDTIPCGDYTDVRVTKDGGTTYETLFSLTKYNTIYGWKQYSVDLDTHMIDQCVKLVFEAMEKSRNGDVTQYIDRIRITAKRDIEITEVLTSELDVCSLQNKEWKLVLTNHTAPVLDYSVTPIDIVLEIVGTPYAYTKSYQSGILAGFASDTITMSPPNFNFAKGTYQLKAYFSSVLDDTPLNDTLRTSLVINPDVAIRVHPESGGNNNCLAGEMSIIQTVTIYNTGNMDLSDIGLILQVDTGTMVTSPYIILRDVYMHTILPGDSAVCGVGVAYKVPWTASLYAGVTAYLLCDSTLASDRHENTECVDTKDLYLVNIDNPSNNEKDNVGSSIPVTVTLRNRSEMNNFNSALTVRITNSQGVQEELFTENQTIGISATASHTFTRSYTVPNDTVYYLTVFTDKQDNYSKNDTLQMKRYTEGVGITSVIGADGLTLYQNTPNPANKRTRIDYSIPEAGEVIFYLHSVSGQLLYAETIEAASGKQSLELNTSAFAAGIYFYSIQYKGQRLVKRMSVQ
jgi:parallel beta-helix repeat protein